MPGSAKPVALKLRSKAQARALLGEFNNRLGREILNIRIYHEHESFIFERQIVERDGTSFTVVLPFRKATAIRNLIAADPYSKYLQLNAERIAVKLEQALWFTHGKPTS